MTLTRSLLLLIGIAILAPFAIDLVHSPAQDRDWKPEYARLPSKSWLEGDLYSIRNIRDFRFDAGGNITQTLYLDRDYDLAKLKALWLGISHFTEIGIAHTLLSFEFEDRPPLVVSVEARMEKGENYSPVKGLLRQYELIFLLATEQDSIGSRLHPRGERVLFYELAATDEERRALFRALMERVTDLEATPEFYNTLTDNCTSSLARHATRLSWTRRWFDYRLLLPGYSDGLAQDLGLLPTGMPIDTLRERAQLDPAMAPLESPEFSQAIRRR